MHVMFIPSWYDNNRNKVHGSFFREQANKLQENGVKVTVAYNEIWPLTLMGKIKEKIMEVLKCHINIKIFSHL